MQEYEGLEEKDWSKETKSNAVECVGKDLTEARPSPRLVTGIAVLRVFHTFA